jgi:2-polyprenyl-6-methoxyphenol hydroxylase-like FAD-dependent oxidoreductase
VTQEVAAMHTQIGDRAVVLGAGVAGLLAARVLADAYGQVTVIDRDELPETPRHRRGVPHGRHLHALAARGQQALEELFPGLTAELVAQGAPAGNLLANARLYLSGHRLRQTDTGLVLLCASRPLLEGSVRARVRALPNVTVLDRCDLVGLATTPDGRRVTGVRVLRRADGSAEDLLSADLVVDATGRGSRIPVWLEALGYARPQTEQVRVGLGYATRTYRPPPDALDGDLAVLQAATPQHPRTGALQRLEGDRWMVTLAGILGDHPPTDPDGFLAFARSLRFPDIYQAVSEAEPLDDPVGFRFPASVRHRYEGLGRFPDGLLVVGDAVASFNPIYGQGMSVAALEALALRRHLEKGAEPQPRRWFRDLAHVVDVPWDMSAGGDLAFPGVQGRRTPKVRLVSAYLARLHAAAAHDARLASAFIHVAGLVAPPQTLLRPQIVVRVLRASLHPVAVPTTLGPAEDVGDGRGEAGKGHQGHQAQDHAPGRQRALVAPGGDHGGDLAGQHGHGGDGGRHQGDRAQREQQQRQVGGDGGRGGGEQRDGPAEPAGQGGDQHAVEEHERGEGDHRHPSRPHQVEVGVARTQGLQPGPGQDQEQGAEGGATGPPGGQPAPQQQEGCS